MKTYISKGTICIKGPYHLIYAVCNITYELHEDDSFKYVFEPNYAVIKLLDSSIFQGIPGLNLDLKEKEYIRTTIPTFISERVPSDKREDYADLLAKVNMEFMDPIEYLIKTKEQYSGDLLFVKPFEEKKIVSFDNYNGNQTNAALMKEVLSSLCLGNDVSINGQIINDNNRKAFHDVFINLYARSYNQNKEKQAQGIENAKKEGSYKGRKPIKVDEMQFFELLAKVEKKEMSPKEAAKQLGISIDKYYRLKNKLQKQQHTLIQLI